MGPELTRRQLIALGAGALGSALIGCDNAASGDDDAGSMGDTGSGGSGSGGNGAGGDSASGAGGTDMGAPPDSGTGGMADTGSGGIADGGSAGTGGMDTGSGGSMAVDSCGADLTADIAGNHGHALLVPMADVIAGEDACYNARGDAGHDHFIDITAADFTRLRDGERVVLTSCNGGDHQYVLSCAQGADPAGAPECGGTPNLGQSC